MKPLFALSVLLLLLTSCKKAIDTSAWKYFRFSIKSKGYTRSYTVANGMLYNDSTRAALSDLQYQKARQVMEGIPPRLVNSEDLTYSCFCGFPILTINAKDGGDIPYTWYIDIGSKNTPRQIDKYANMIDQFIYELE